ncbi:hypothetical protein [Streptomyces sp. NPDC001568]|uniref:hypothetical protein n=1 Tax=Streptomyces sp. NPDC001568 TaxID=3364588 RepID=UPI0036BD45F0
MTQVQAGSETFEVTPGGLADAELLLFHQREAMTSGRYQAGVMHERTARLERAVEDLVKRLNVEKAGAAELDLKPAPADLKRHERVCVVGCSGHLEGRLVWAVHTESKRGGMVCLTHYDTSKVIARLRGGVQMTSETYTEMITYTSECRPNEPWRNFEREWSGQGWADIEDEDGDVFRPHQLRVRWMQVEGKVEWQLIQVTGRAVVDGKLTRHESRFVWTQHHNWLGGPIAADVMRFVEANTPEARTAGSTRT